MFTNRASKSGMRGFGKRRTVVQLEDEPRRQPAYGFGYKPADEVQKPEATGNALSGIMSQYAMDSPSDDNSDEDEEIQSNGPPAQETHKDNKKWPKFVAATDTQLPTFKVTETIIANDKQTESKQQVPVSSGTSVSSVTSASSVTGAVGDDIDLKLKDFLAEIESIDVPGENPHGEEAEAKVEEKQTLELKPQEPKPQEPKPQEPKPQEPKPADPEPDSDADNGIGTSEDDASPPVEPKEPVSVWQHCLDEGTQCYYYWNTETNQVTWEIPPGFSQYLLRYKEYKRLLSKYEKEMAEWKRLHGGRKTKRSTKKERKHKKKVEDKDVEVIEPLVSYPPIPEEEQEAEGATPLVYGPLKPPDDVLEKLGEIEPMTEDAESSSTEPQTLHSEPKENADKNLVALSDAEKAGVDSSSTSKKHHRSKSSKHHTEAEDVEVGKHQDIKSHDSEVRKAKSQDRDAKSVPQSCPVADGCASLSAGTQTGTSDDGRTCETSAKVIPEAKDEMLLLLPVGDTQVEELEDEDDFVNRELEEPIFTHYEYVNKKYEEEPIDDVELAVEDIDRELELALERRMNKTEAGFVSKKRKQEFLEKDSDSDAKRQKTESSADDPVSSDWKTSIRDEIKTKVDELAQVLDLVTTVLEKLEFLEVSQSCLSKLQVLLVQTQTRLEDWKAGGLSTGYMLQRLQESAATLQQYEQNASPPGWSCLWDRTFKRYFYSNNITGENSWAYPEVDLDTPVNQQSHEAKGTTMTSPYRDALIDESELRYHSATSQVATDGALLVHVREPSEAGSDNALPIPSDLLSWAANPPPPPPATTPPPPPSPSQNSEPFSTSEMDCDNTEMDDQSVNLLTENGMDLPQEDQGSSPGREPVLLVTEPPQLPPGQISAPPMITKPAVQPLASTHKDGVASITLSAVSPDGSAAVVLPSGVIAQEGPYDGEPMEDPAAAGSHHVKEKKKKKEKSLLGGGLAMKKKNVSSMVEKWQKIQVDFSKEDEKEINRQMKLAELAAKASSASLKTD